MQTIIENNLELVHGVDRIELHVRGSWSQDGFSKINALPFNETSQLGEYAVTKSNGGWQSPDFYPCRLQVKGQFQILPFTGSSSGYECRLLVYSQFLKAAGWQGSIEQLRRYLSSIGCKSDKEEISRLDLKVDVPILFAEFASQIDNECWFSRMKPDLEKSDDSSRYFGKIDNLQLVIYDKSKEQGWQQATTRVEFRINRRYLLSQSIDATTELNVCTLWRTLLQTFRISERPKDSKHPERCGVWSVWKSICDSEWQEAHSGNSCAAPFSDSNDRS